MRILPLLLAALPLLAAPARAWEARAAEADARIAQAQSEWKTAKGAPVLRDALHGVRQGKKPGWAKKLGRKAPKAAWSEAFNGKTYFFGAGFVEKVKDPALRQSTAEDRARAALSELLGQKEVPGAIPVDWYGERKGNLYCLLVLVR